MKRSILCLLVFVAHFAYAQDFKLKTGDLLFQAGRSGAFNDAIAASTGSDSSVQYTHVGMAVVGDSGVYVLEATMPFVAKTLLDKYLARSAQKDGKPVVSVGRLKPAHESSIGEAVTIMESLVGKQYDYVFDLFNDAYYCTEIVFLSFIAADRSYIFESRPMTFRNKDTGETAAGWVTHFQRHKATIPEGEKGTNPVDMSRSGAIDIIHHYFEPRRAGTP